MEGQTERKIIGEKISLHDYLAKRTFLDVMSEVSTPPEHLKLFSSMHGELGPIIDSIRIRRYFDRAIVRMRGKLLTGPDETIR